MTEAPAGQVRVGLGRSNAVIALAVLGFLAWIVWAGARGGWHASEASARYLGFGVAALFVIPLLMMLWALPRFLSPRYVVFDEHGLRIRHGRREAVVGWADLAGVGIAYQRAAEEPTTLPASVDEVRERVQEYLADAAAEALQVSGKRRIVLEIYPARTDAGDRVPLLKPYWKVLTPPAAGLPAWGWSFPLPPVVSIAREIARGAQAVRPDRWIGWYARPWTG